MEDDDVRSPTPLNVPRFIDAADIEQLFATFAVTWNVVVRVNACAVPATTSSAPAATGASRDLRMKLPRVVGSFLETAPSVGRSPLARRGRNSTVESRLGVSQIQSNDSVIVSM